MNSKELLHRYGGKFKDNPTEAMEELLKQLHSDKKDLIGQRQAYDDGGKASAIKEINGRYLAFLGKLLKNNPELEQQDEEAFMESLSIEEKKIIQGEDFSVRMLYAANHGTDFPSMLELSE